MDADHDAAYAQLAVKFARALVGLDFQGAHELLSPGFRALIGPDRLQRNYEKMVEYGESPAVDAMLMGTMETWPTRQPMDLGWAYVAIVGDDFSEAVTVVVEEQENGACIRHLEWGRP